MSNPAKFSGAEFVGMGDGVAVKYIYADIVVPPKLLNPVQPGLDNFSIWIGLEDVNDTQVVQPVISFENDEWQVFNAYYNGNVAKMEFYNSTKVNPGDIIRMAIRFVAFINNKYNYDCEFTINNLSTFTHQFQCDSLLPTAHAVVERSIPWDSFKNIDVIEFKSMRLMTMGPNYTMVGETIGNWNVSNPIVEHDFVVSVVNDSPSNGEVRLKVHVN